ncbi:hypothetical protein ACFXTN_025011 [Malus domestica]
MMTRDLYSMLQDSWAIKNKYQASNSPTFGPNRIAEQNQQLRLSSKKIEPKRVTGLDQVNVCAAFASGVVSAAVGNDGSLWVWGKSKRGQLGLGNDGH